MKMRIITHLLPGLLMCLSANGIPLLGGRFETTTDVTGFLNLALDAAEIQASNDVTEKTELYKRVRKLARARHSCDFVSNGFFCAAVTRVETHM
jgi:hypothetical protein